MAEITLEPTALSKVIPISLKINDTDATAVTRLATKKQFNTSDTDAWLSFALEGLESTSGEYDLTMVNVDEKPIGSIVHKTSLPFSAIPFYYKMDSGADLLTNEIRHAGRWIGQIVVRLANGDTTSRQFDFAISGHLLDGNEARLILIEDYNSLIATITAAKTELEGYNVDYAALIADVDAKEALREQAEIDRAATFAALVDSEMIAQNVETKLTEKEATYAPRLLSVESELADIIKEVVYVIDLNRWGIKNDETDATATTNGINQALAWAASQYYNTCVLPRGIYLIDATATEPNGASGGIEIPNDMTFRMARNVILKTQANGSWAYNVIRVKDEQNVKIKGGEIVGDRYQHDFNNPATPVNRGTHEWGYGIIVKSSKNVEIKNVKIKDCTGDSILIGSTGLIGSNYVPSEKIIVHFCELDGARRNNISITGVDGVDINHNKILNAGILDGTAPRFGIDVEGYGEGAIDYETPLNVRILNNKFIGNVNSSVTNYNGYGVIIKGNFSDNLISYGLGTETVITGNVFNTLDAGKTGIGSNGVSQSADENQTIIHSNIIIGFDIGIDLRGKNVTATSNIIKSFNTVGIKVYLASDVLISANKISKTTGKGVEILQSNHVIIQNNKLREVGLLAIDITQSSTVIEVLQNKIEYSKAGVKIVGGSATIKGNIINSEGYASAGSDIQFDGTSVVTIEENVIKDSTSYSVNGANSSGKARILKNTFEGFLSFNPIYLVGGKYEITDNIIVSKRTSTGGYGIAVSGGDGCILIGNRIYSVGGYNLTNAIKTDGSINSKIIANVNIGGTILNNASDFLSGNTVV